AEEAAKVAAWDSPWHRPVHGGHSQLCAYLDDQHPAMGRWNERFAAIGEAAAFEREILVALQPIGGRRAVWEALARQIEAAPAAWRWWIRRHPSSTVFQDAEHDSLRQLRRPNVLIEEASELPLPALLRHMSVTVSLASGASTEAAAFGVPSLFVDEEAPALFPGLLARGEAELIDIAEVSARIAALPASPARARAAHSPPIGQTLERLQAMAGDYRRLCQAEPLER